MTPDWINSARYLSLVTFRANGERVATPVWFAVDAQGRLVVYSALDAGKMRRVRKNPVVEVAQCGATGTVAGPFVTGRAFELTGADAVAANKFLTKKYTYQKWIVDTSANFKAAIARKARPVDGCLAITLD